MKSIITLHCIDRTGVLYQLSGSGGDVLHCRLHCNIDHTGVLMFNMLHQKVSTLGVLYQLSGSGGDVMQVRSPPINLARGIHTRGYKDNDGW